MDNATGTASNHLSLGRIAASAAQVPPVTPTSRARAM
jgi:hypothetical protein